MTMGESTIMKTREVRANLDSVWKVVSDTENEERYWTNLRDVKVVKRDGNTIVREAKVGPSGFAQRSKQTIILEPMSAVGLTMTSDALDGERTIRLAPAGEDGTRIEVVWKLRPKNVPRFVEGILKDQIAAVTDLALAKIANSVER